MKPLQLNRQSFIGGLVLTICAGLCFVPPADGQSKGRRPLERTVARQRPLSAREIVAKVSPSLVLVVTQDKDGNPLAQASGFFYRPGLVATNLHVLKRAASGYIKLVGMSGSYQIEKVDGIDMQHDLCALRVSLSAHSLPLALGYEGMTRAGDEVYVAGNPIGLEGSFSKGIVSAVRPEVGLIQLDASISPGSSGGPVVNTSGHVVAVATSSAVNGQNVNFAVAASYLESLLKWRMAIDIAGALAISDRENDKLKGAVKSVTTNGSSNFVEYKAYDLKGNLLEWSTSIAGRLLT